MPFFVYDKETKVFSIRKILTGKSPLLIEPIDKNILMLNFIDKQITTPMPELNPLKQIYSEKTFIYLRLDERSIIPTFPDWEEIITNQSDDEF